MRKIVCNCDFCKKEKPENLLYNKNIPLALIDSSIDDPDMGMKFDLRFMIPNENYDICYDCILKILHKQLFEKWDWKQISIIPEESQSDSVTTE